MESGAPEHAAYPPEDMARMWWDGALPLTEIHTENYLAPSEDSALRDRYRGGHTWPPTHDEEW